LAGPLSTADKGNRHAEAQRFQLSNVLCADLFLNQCLETGGYGAVDCLKFQRPSAEDHNSKSSGLSETLCLVHEIFEIGRLRRKTKWMQIATVTDNHPTEGREKLKARTRS
jgi:hypothetical protein